jgi:hypothetical protein
LSKQEKQDFWVAEVWDIERGIRAVNYVVSLDCHIVSVIMMGPLKFDRR